MCVSSRVIIIFVFKFMNCYERERESVCVKEHKGILFLDMCTIFRISTTFGKIAMAYGE